MTPAAAIEARDVAKEYRATTALRDCTIDVPRGRISALVGPNGAGKTTLLLILAALRRPTRGDVLVLGRPPAQDPAFLADIGFLAQEIPLYRRLTADEHLRMGAHLNRRWDGETARAALRALDIPLERPVGTLSGGQRAQVALALALAKQPKVLLLDEPVAALDPLARRHFLAALATAVASRDLTVLLSSHLVNDIERVCDHIVLLASARPQLCGDIDDVLAEHKVLVGARRDTAAIERDHHVVQIDSTPRQTTMVVRVRGPIVDPSWAVHDMGLEELVLAYMGSGTAPAPPRAIGAVG